MKPGKKVRVDMLELDHKQARDRKSEFGELMHHDVWSRGIYTVRTFCSASNSVSLKEDMIVKDGKTKHSGCNVSRERVQLLETPVTRERDAAPVSEPEPEPVHS